MSKAQGVLNFHFGIGVQPERAANGGLKYGQYKK